MEAGTGTGKTFAYLVPALLSGLRVLISTGTRTLQDQLFSKDLPLVAAALGRPARVALLKGRANYLCRYRIERLDSHGEQLALEHFGVSRSRAAQAMLARISAGPAPPAAAILPRCAGFRTPIRCGRRSPPRARIVWVRAAPEFARCHVVRRAARRWRRTSSSSTIICCWRIWR